MADPPPLEVQKHFELALIHRAMGENMDAIREFRAVIAAVPDYTPARSALAIMLGEDGRTEAAILEFNALLAADPADLGAYMHLGLLHEKLGDWARATAAYEGFLERAGAEAESHIAYVRHRIAELERAPAKAKLAAAKVVSPNRRLHRTLLGGVVAIALAFLAKQFAGSLWDSYERWRWPARAENGRLSEELSQDGQRWRLRRVVIRYKEVLALVDKADAAGRDVAESRRKLEWVNRLIAEGKAEYAAALLDSAAITIPRGPEPVRVAEQEPTQIDVVLRQTRADKARGARPAARPKKRGKAAR